MNPEVWLSEDQLTAFRDSPVEGPVVFVNLLKIRPLALYPPGTEEPGFTGLQAYDRYRAVARGAARSVGGRVLWYGHALPTLVGPADEPQWDEMALAEYPTRQAFLDMIIKPEYRAVLVHREAAIERCRVYPATTLLRNLDP